MKLFTILGFAILAVSTSQGQTAAGRKDIQTLITDAASTASDAAIPIMYWSDPFIDAQHIRPAIAGVLGTGFLVDDQGDFITAAHVATIKEVGPPGQRIKVRLTANIRQSSGDAAGRAFTVLEADNEHDLALCHIDNFHVSTLANSPLRKIPMSPGTLTREQMSHPFASLAVSKNAPVVGHFVLVSGFPLGSWTPAIQLGLVSAVETFYPPNTPVAGVPKDTGHLLQISVNANHGNSGGPVIDMVSGQVVGVILQIVPAPLNIQGNQFYDPGTFAMSGIMLAAPASWVQTLLAKHDIKSHGVRAGKLIIW